jgi:actin-related protein 5
MRYGFAISQSPYVSTNVVAKYKDRKNGKQLLLFGQAVEADSASRLAMKTPWEGDVLCNSEALVRSGRNVMSYSK